MSTPSLHDRLADEICKIPESRLAEVFDFVHYFRLGLEAAGSNVQDSPDNDSIAAFCGSGRGGSVEKLLEDRRADLERES